MLAGGGEWVQLVGEGGGVRLAWGRGGGVRWGAGGGRPVAQFPAPLGGHTAVSFHCWQLLLSQDHWRTSAPSAVEQPATSATFPVALLVIRT